MRRPDDRSKQSDQQEAGPQPPEDGDRHRGVRQDDQDADGSSSSGSCPIPSTARCCRRRTVCHAHDEANTSHKGDVVEIMETRPLSKLKRWRIVRIVRSAPSKPWPARTRPPGPDGITDAGAGSDRHEARSNLITSSAGGQSLGR